MRIKAKHKVIPKSFLKIKESRTLRWNSGEKGAVIVELVNAKSPSPEAFPRAAREGRRGKSKKDVRRRATARGAMDKSGVSGSLGEKQSEETTKLTISS